MRAEIYSHLANTLVDIGVLRQGVNLAGGQLQHALLTGLGSNLGLDDGDLLLRESSLLLDLLQKLAGGQERGCWKSALGQLTFCRASFGMDMAAGVLPGGLRA